MKKAKILTLAAIMVAGVSTFAQSRSMNFDTTKTWAEIKARAKKENKLIFMDAYTSWCGPCKWMAKNIFTNDTVADFYNQNFICSAYDMEKGEGKDLAKKYEVQCYPNLLYIDGDGNLVHRKAGGMQSQDFIQLGKDAQDPQKQFANLKKQYDNNNREPKFLLTYLDKMSGTCLKTDTVLAEYFKTQKESDLTSLQNWRVIYQYTRDVDSREFNYLSKHIDEYAQVTTVDSVSDKIFSTYLNKCYHLIYAKNPNDSLYTAYKTKIKNSGFKRGEEIITKGDMAYYGMKKDWNNYAQTAVRYFDNYGKEDYQGMNNEAWTFYQHIDDKALLQKAEQWTKTATAKVDDYYNHDTYAAVLYKLQKKEEALKQAEIAIAKAKELKLDYKSTEDLLEKIKGLK